ncbi:MAG TPA: hypothetical protein VI383_09200, partial [Gemmatimonadales bacterium]|nr:hypothetical protein [Gemmatimonadales bacterium]
MNLDKLKEAARKYEQREDWRRAIDVYIQAIQEAESETGETTQDPALYNRLGDLQLKAGDLVSALRAYEEAAELYTDQGFFNNAIALCGKILRINPNRVPAHLRLAQLHARKNFVGEARRSLAEYVARMSGPRQRAEAVAALELFADQFSGNPELRSMLVDLLRDATPGGGGGGPEDPDFERLARRLEGGGEAGGRPGSGPPWPAPAGETGSERGRHPEHLGRGVAFHNDLIFLDTGTDGEGRIPIEAIDGLLPRASEGLVPTKAGRARDAAP